MKSNLPNIPGLLFLTSLAFAAIAGISTHASEYRFLQEIAIGGDGGYDYVTIDSKADRLYISHATKCVMLDTRNNKIVGEIEDTPGIHGIAIAEDIKRGFTSNGREARVSIFDLTTSRTVSKVPTGANPDAILYEAGQQEVYTFNGVAKNSTVFDAKTGTLVATIPLSGKPEFAVADSKAGLIYCNIEDKSEIAVIDVKSHQVVKSWGIAPGEEASGMAIDLDHHRLFVGCHNKLMAMIDNTSGKVLSTVPIGAGVDANAFDPDTQTAFSSNGDGTVTIAHEDSPEKLSVVQTLKTERGARTMALDPQTKNIYLPVGSGKSFKILVYGK